MPLKPQGTNRWWWFVLAAISLLVSILGVATSQGWAAPTETALTPPYATPVVAGSMLTSAEVSSMYGEDLTLSLSGPPSEQVFLSSSPYAADLRQGLYDQAWELLWDEPGGVGHVMLRVYEYRRHSQNGKDTSCKPEVPADLGDLVLAAGRLGTGETATDGCLVARKGRVVFSARVRLVGADHAARLVPLLRQIANTQMPRLADSADNPAPEGWFRATRASLLRGWVLGLIALASLSVLPSLLFDRATGERLSRRFRGRQTNPFQTDIEDRVGRLSLKTRALALLRFAALVVALRLAEVWHFGGHLTTGVILGVFLVGVLVERQVLNTSRRLHQVRIFRGVRLLVLALGLLVSGVLVGGSVLLWNIGGSFTAIGMAPGLPDWRAERSGLLFQVAAAVLFLVALTPLTLARRVAMRLARHRQPADSRAPVLLLRSFADDSVRMRARRLDRAGILDRLLLKRWESFEEVQASALSKFGPVIAVGTPGERLPPPLGAVRLQLSHEEWQSRVSQLLEESTFILFTLGRSEGLAWEMRRILDCGYLHKTIFLVPPVPPSERRTRLSVLAQVYDVPWEILDTHLTGRTVLAVCWPLAAAHPLVVCSAGPDDLSYDIAIETCVDRLHAADTTQASTPAQGPRESRRAEIAGIPDAAFRLGKRPDPIVIPAGTAKRQRSWKRNPAFWSLIINLAVMPFVLPLLTGNPFGTYDPVIRIELPSGHTPSAVLGGSGENLWIVIDGNVIAGADTSSMDIVPLWRLRGEPTHFVMVGRDVYYLSPASGDLGAFDTHSKKPLWTVNVGAGATALAVDGTRIFVAQAPDKKILALDTATGAMKYYADLSCSPWDVAMVSGDVYAVCPDTGLAFSLNAVTLVQETRVQVPRGASHLLAWKGAAWVMTTVDRKIVPVSSATVGPVIWTPEPLARVTARNGILAVEGIDRISVFSSRVTRQLTDGGITDIAITDDGHVVYADAHSVVWLR